jgi:hypothetical protein
VHNNPQAVNAILAHERNIRQEFSRRLARRVGFDVCQITNVTLVGEISAMVIVVRVPVLAGREAIGFDGFFVDVKAVQPGGEARQVIFDQGELAVEFRAHERDRPVGGRITRGVINLGDERIAVASSAHRRAPLACLGTPVHIAIALTDALRSDINVSSRKPQAYDE